MNPIVQRNIFIVTIAILAAIFGIKVVWSSLSHADTKVPRAEVKLKDDFMAQLGTGAAPVLQGAFRGDVFTSFESGNCTENCEQGEATIDPNINIFLSPKIKNMLK